MPHVRALLLLLATGALLGLSTILIKFAPGADLSPVALLTWACAGAAVVLTLRARPVFSRAAIEYYAIAAAITVVASNVLFYMAVAHVGVGFVALSLAFPPVLTYAGALALGMEKLHPARAAGVVAALAGAATLALLKLDASDAPAIWIAAPFLGAALLAAGNIYRSARWPAGVAPEALASGMLIAAAIMLFAVGALPGFDAAIPSASGAMLVVAQGATFAAMYLLYFPLQKIGGPVYLSLLGSVATLCAIPVAVLALGEAPPPGLAPAGALIALGVFLVVRYRR